MYEKLLSPTGREVKKNAETMLKGATFLYQRTVSWRYDLATQQKVLCIINTTIVWIKDALQGFGVDVSGPSEQMRAPVIARLKEIDVSLSENKKGHRNER